MVRAYLKIFLEAILMQLDILAGITIKYGVAANKRLSSFSLRNRRHRGSLVFFEKLM